MKVKKFLKVLDNWYYNPVVGNVVVKFYFQHHTFSYELHNNNKICYTTSSKLYESRVFDIPFCYDNEGAYSEILLDIVKESTKFYSIHKLQLPDKTYIYQIWDSTAVPENWLSVDNKLLMFDTLEDAEAFF